MKKYYNIFTMLVIALVAGLSLTACSEDDLDTNQYLQGVHLNVYGPQPVMRGGMLRFLGSNLDQVASVTIPGVSPITSIEVIKSGVPSEIRVQVPKDGPEVGKVVLTTKTNETITTLTELTYEEPIEFASFSPASAMPGEVITIEGDYLNLIHMVEFTDGVQVSENDFAYHDRYKIQVAVPETAKTGIISLYTADLTALEDPSADVSYNIMESENVLNVGTATVSKLASPRGEASAQGTVTVKQGETITITGSYFGLIEKVDVAGVEVTEFNVSGDGKTLSFVVPAAAPDGDVNLVCRSGVEVPVGKIETVAPSNCSVTPNPVKAGGRMIIRGEDLDVVSEVLFDNVADAVEFSVTGVGIVINAVPETAQEGEGLTLRMANGKEVKVPFTLVKPVATAYNANPVSAGGVLIITGTDLDLVSGVDFGGAVSDPSKFEATESAITVTVPMEAKSGKPQLILKNGTTVEAPELNIEEALFCYATELPGEDEEIKAGNTLKLSVANSDKLTGVEINGKACQYILAGDGKTQLIIGIPESAGSNSKVRLISSNGEITYSINVIPNTEVTTVLWNGNVDLGQWTLNWTIGDGSNGANNPNMFADMELQAGDVIRLYITPYSDWWQVQFFDGHWGGQTEIGNATGLNNNNNVNAGIYNLEEHGGAIDITVTEALAEQLTTLTDWGYCWIVQGENVVVNKIAVTHYTVLEQTLWTGDLDFDGWNINWQIGDGTAGASNPNMFVDAGLKAGMTVRLYIEPYSDWWQVQFFDGHWGGQAEIGNATGLNNANNINAGIYNLEDHGGAIEIPVTAALAEQLTTLTDWGYCWILQGEGCKAVKITVE